MVVTRLKIRETLLVVWTVIKFLYDNCILNIKKFFLIQIYVLKGYTFLKMPIKTYKNLKKYK